MLFKYNRQKIDFGILKNNKQIIILMSMIIYKTMVIELLILVSDIVIAIYASLRSLYATIPEKENCSNPFFFKILPNIL